jgi:lipopolysaccharide/colanic/teichoic acid biosynthesis glycosyltransferase
MTEISYQPRASIPFAGVLRSPAYLPNLQLALKEILEPALALVGLVLVAPLLGLICLLIRLDSPGCAIFAQERIGRFGRPFTMYKLRTMRDGAEAELDAVMTMNEASGPAFKIRQDPRTTRLGSWLRRAGLDELPQLLNVVRGDMSLVGPRPPLVREVAAYEPWQVLRLAVRPGVTCLWQVSPERHSQFDEWMRMDLEYIEHWSLRLDLKILLLTLPVMLKQGF